MRQENQLGPAEREVEEVLSRLTLPALTIDRDRLMYEAGRRSQGRSILVWRTAALLLFIGIGLSLMVRPAPRTVERLRYVSNPSPASAVVASADLSRTSYLALQRKVLSEGVDGLPHASEGTRAAAPEPLTIQGLLSNSSRGI
jgi:hypothetical protein